MSIRLYVGNLPRELEKEELETFFAEQLGDFASTKLVTDRKTGKSRGFGFVTVETSEQADQVIEKLNGQPFKDGVLKIEKALPREKAKEEETNIPSNSDVSNNTNNRRGGKGKSRRTSSSTSTSLPTESAQPDPRWAHELEKLKQMLAAQTSSS